jgi:hypothetical protein
MANNYTDYIVLEARNWTDLANDVVRKMVNARYQCQGGVMIVALGDDDYLYAQAMIHVNTEETN